MTTRQSRITTDHEEIRKWAEKFGGRPQVIDDPQAEADTMGIRIDFPDHFDDEFLSETKVRDVSWEEFFRKLDEQDLALMYVPNLNITDLKSIYKGYRFIKRHPPDKSQEEINKQVDEFMRELGAVTLEVPEDQ
jgi:hypothetical protein